MEMSLIRPAEDRHYLEGIEYSLTWTFKHYNSYKNLKRSASRGCDLCSIFVAGLLASCWDQSDIDLLKRLPDEEGAFKVCLVPETLPPHGNTNVLQYATKDEALCARFLVTSPTGTRMPASEHGMQAHANIR
jgi:hypothetical protein